MQFMSSTLCREIKQNYLQQCGFHGTGSCIYMYFDLGEVNMSEEEEDIAPLHIVNTDVGEMPEGAQVSDGEELDSRPNDDPHKALDINLDEYVLCIFITHVIEQLIYIHVAQ